MAERILRAFGRGLLVVLRAIGPWFRMAGTAIIRLLWEAVVEIFRGLARGLGDVLRRLMPWLAGGMIFLGLFKYAPETLEAVLSLVLALAIMVWGFKTMLKAIFPPPKKKRRR